MTRKSKRRAALLRGPRDESGRIDPIRAIEIHAVAMDDGFWVHTHGLSDFGLPELEARAVPTWLRDPCAGALDAIADYLFNSGRQVRPGEVITLERYGLAQLVVAEPREPIAGHYDHPRWTLVNAKPEMCPCDSCEARRRRRGPSAVH